MSIELHQVGDLSLFEQPLVRSDANPECVYLAASRNILERNLAIALKIINTKFLTNDFLNCPPHA